MGATPLVTIRRTRLVLSTKQQQSFNIYEVVGAVKDPVP